MSNGGLYVKEAGHGLPLVLLHGWSCHSGFFKPQFKALRDTARILAPDLPGHGETADRLPLSIEAAADAVGNLLEERDLKNVTLCGWSMGAHVAYSLIQRHGSDRIRQIIGIDMTPKVLNTADWTLGAAGGLDQDRNDAVMGSMEIHWPQLSRKIARRIFASEPEPDPDLLAFAETEIAAADPLLLKPMWSSLTSQDFRELLREFPVPLHMALGGRSSLYGPALRQWHLDNVANVHIHDFSSSGHSPHLEEKGRFNGFLRWLLAPAEVPVT